MKFSPLLFLAPCLLAAAPQEDLPLAVKQARLVTIAPRPTPPSWMDYDRVRQGYVFLTQHGKTVSRVLGTCSLASTFAARDVAPILMQTGRLPKDFNKRMNETEAQIVKILFPMPGREGFLSRNYAQAVSLGQLHVDMANLVRDPLKWDAKVRVPLNGQSYAFVLYSFAWWPVEAMIASKEIDENTSLKALDDWFHLWSVIGYGMGVPENLLPQNYARAKEIVTLLRTAQYAHKGERLPEGIPTLLGAHVCQLAERAAAQQKSTPEAMTPEAAKMFAQWIAYSPGLTEALGLGADPATRLIQYAGAK